MWPAWTCWPFSFDVEKKPLDGFPAGYFLAMNPDPPGALGCTGFTARAFLYRWTGTSWSLVSQKQVTAPRSLACTSTPRPGPTEIVFSNLIPGSRYRFAGSVVDGAGKTRKFSVTGYQPVRQAQIQTILGGRCVGCHSSAAPSAGLNLENVRASLGVASTQCGPKSRIVSGNGAASYLVHKLSGFVVDGSSCFSGSTMPAAGAVLAPKDLALIMNWIDMGGPS